MNTSFRFVITPSVYFSFFVHIQFIFQSTLFPDAAVLNVSVRVFSFLMELFYHKSIFFYSTIKLKSFLILKDK